MLREMRGAAPDIDLLHINCEGCEWEMLENLVESGLMAQVPLRPRPAPSPAPSAPPPWQSCTMSTRGIYC